MAPIDGTPHSVGSFNAPCSQWPPRKKAQDIGCAADVTGHVTNVIREGSRSRELQRARGRVDMLIQRPPHVDSDPDDDSEGRLELDERVIVE